MNITIKEQDKTCTFAVSGRLDSNTTPELEESVKSYFDKVDVLIFDFADLEYISSAGLRVLLASHKKMAMTNKLVKITNVSDTVKEIFELTGMDNIFIVE